MSVAKSPAPIEVDVAILGAGSAGLVAWRRAKAEGATVVLCDPGPLGTTCARVGCMPSKLMISPSNFIRSLQKAREYGIEVGAPTIDGKRVMARVQRERDRFASFSVKPVLEAPEGEYIAEAARFTGPNTLVTDSGIEIRAKAIVVATGARSFIPAPLDQLSASRLTTDTIFEQPDLPKRLAVVGTGAIGLEMAQAMRGLGVEVTLFNHHTTLGGISDPAVHEVFRELLVQDLRLFENTTIEHAEELEHGARLRWKDEQGQAHDETFDKVLCATGRPPNDTALQLERAGVQRDEKGRLRFDPHALHLEGSAIFVAGDVNGFRNLLHEAADEGIIAGENAARYAKDPTATVARFKRRTPMSIVFSYPQIASGGLGFRELPNDEFVIGEVALRSQGRARVDQENQGIVRLYAHKSDGRLLGFAMTSHDAEHHAHLLTWAIQQRLTLTDLLDMPFYHPVTEEGLRTAFQSAIKQLTLPERSRLPRLDEGA